MLFVSGDKMDYIIGIDGGGTKTEAVAYSLNGQELAASKAAMAICSLITIRLLLILMNVLRRAKLRLLIIHVRHFTGACWK